MNIPNDRNRTRIVRTSVLYVLAILNLVLMATSLIMSKRRQEQDAQLVATTNDLLQCVSEKKKLQKVSDERHDAIMQMLNEPSYEHTPVPQRSKNPKTP